MKKIVSIIALLLLFVGIFSGCGQNANQIEVTTVKAKGADAISDLSWNQTIQALSSVDVVPNSSGKVTSIPVQEGQAVQPDSVLFTLDATDVALQVRQAEASLSVSQVALSSASASSSQNAGVLPAQVASDDANANYSRVKALYEAGGVSQSEYEIAKSKMDTAASQLATAKINQNSSYNSAQAQVNSAKAALDLARKKLSDCTVTSPIAGKVAKIDTEIGTFVSAQSPTVTVIDDSGLKVVIPVAETDISQLTLGTSMSIHVQALSEDADGSISEIAAICDPETGMFDVTVTLQDPGSKVTAGMTATVKLAGEKKTDSVYVPTKGITTKSGKSWVFVVKNGQAVKQNVTLGKKKNAYQEITTGLNAESEVIVQSSGTLKDGTPVRLITVD